MQILRKLDSKADRYIDTGIQGVMIKVTRANVKVSRKAKIKPDYEGYEKYKQMLLNIRLTGQEYEKLIKKAARIYGV